MIVSGGFLRDSSLQTPKTLRTETYGFRVSGDPPNPVIGMKHQAKITWKYPPSMAMSRLYFPCQVITPTIIWSRPQLLKCGKKKRSWPPTSRPRCRNSEWAACRELQPSWPPDRLCFGSCWLQAEEQMLQKIWDVLTFKLKLFKPPYWKSWSLMTIGL